MSDNIKFISLEDEIILRRAIRIAYEHEGWTGIYQIMGEMSRSLEITAEIALEINDEEAKKKKGEDHGA